jgi:hypothetical protein
MEATNLGEAVVAPDSRCALVSYITAPLTTEHTNTYVVFVTDAALAGTVESFEWSFMEEGSAPVVVTTDAGEVNFTPTNEGHLSTRVRLLDGSVIEQAALTLVQHVVLPNAHLEALITRSQHTPGPGGGNPVASRELVNEHASYYQQVELPTPQDGDAFRRLLFDMALNGVIRRTAKERRAHIDQLGAAVNDDPPAVARLAARGAGVCEIRLALLAMVLPASGGATPHLPWRELRDTGTRRTIDDQQLRNSLTTLSDETRIDLFNVARFPKSNIMACARILDTLRNRYFSGATFPDVLTGMSGTRAHWIIRHFREGPLTRA